MCLSSKITLEERSLWLLLIFKVNISLISLMSVCFVFISLRQIINYKNAVSDQLKWTIGNRLGLSLFNKILSCRSERIEKIKRGEFTLSLENESQSAAALLISYLRLWEVSLSLVIYSGILFYTAPLVAAGIVLVISAVVYALSFLFKRTHLSAVHSVSARRNAYNFASQRFGLWQQIKLSSTLGVELSLLGKLFQEMLNARREIITSSMSLNLFYIPLTSAVFFMCLYVFVEVISIEIASIILFVLIMLRLIPIGQSYQNVIARISVYDASLIRLQELFDITERDREIIDQGLGLKNICKGFAFEAVSFSYSSNKKPVFKDVSVNVPIGEITAITGPSGAGKTTFVELLAGMRSPNSGKVLVDDRDLQDYKLRDLDDKWLL